MVCFKILYRHLCVGAEENHEPANQDSLSQSQDFNPEISEYEVGLSSGPRF
jgi:hypothetical protein